MKRALVTGGHKGLGFGWSETLAANGYTVVIASRKETDAAQAVQVLRDKGYQASALVLDIAKEVNIARAAEKVAITYGKLDLLVNNAGINPKDYQDKERRAKAFNIDALDFEEMERVYRVNSLAPLMMVKHFKPLLKKAVKPIVLNISSWLSSVNNLSFGGHYGYVSSKNLLNMLTKSLALEIKNEGIIAITVNPGWVQTAMGGPKATFTPLASAENVTKNVLAQVSLEDSGKFFNYDGNLHPW